MDLLKSIENIIREIIAVSELQSLNRDWIDPDVDVGEGVVQRLKKVLATLEAYQRDRQEIAYKTVFSLIQCKEGQSTRERVDELLHYEKELKSIDNAIKNMDVNIEECNVHNYGQYVTPESIKERLKAVKNSHNGYYGETCAYSLKRIEELERLNQGMHDDIAKTIEILGGKYGEHLQSVAKIHKDQSIRDGIWEFASYLKATCAKYFPEGADSIDAIAAVSCDQYLKNKDIEIKE